MTLENIRKGITLLCNTSLQVKGYFENDQNLVDALNNVPKGDLEQCVAFYQNRTGVIIDLRKELIENLNNNVAYTVNSLYGLIDKHKSGKENQFQAYTKLFPIFYPPITFYGHNEQREFVSKFIDKLISDLGLKDKVEITSYDFQGPRQQGSDRYWVAIYNKEQVNQSSSLQIFIEFHHGKINYGIYKHSEKLYVKPRQQFGASDFDYQQMLDYFMSEKDLIVNDKPDYSNAKQISLNGNRLYKMSHGAFKAKKHSDIINAFKENNWIAIHETTGKGQVENFKNKLHIGDYVYITLGSNELIGIARITSNECDYIPNDIVGNDEWLYREVEMIQPAVRKSPKPLKDSRNYFPSGNSTLAEVKPNDLEEANNLLFKPYFNVEFISNAIEKERDASDREVYAFYKAPLNQIFYGPPGTGKTYHTILEAAKIITGNEAIDYDSALNKFNENLGDQIEFITFHQNYSYEDFIQGLRPDTEASGELSFFKNDGVFKKIADRALKNYKESNTDVQKKKSFSEVFEEYIFPLVEGEVTEIEVKMKKVSFYITNIKDKSIEFRKTSGGTDHTLSIATLEKMYADENTQDIQGLSSYYRPLLNELLKIGKLNITERITRKNYVIIIDEINRANISRVFGELITLIEKDKRYGGKIPINATLPSGDKFIVPSNLYIIGTMNTADKSIALLDIALRRRFEFVPMYPNSNSTKDKIVHDAIILDAINQEIISRKGHDFTIGHSYFMGEDYNLKNTIDNKVIPLLLEYFMNDFDEVKKILSVSKLELEGWPMKLKLND